MTTGPNQELNGDLAKLHRSPRDMSAWHSGQQHLLKNEHARALSIYQRLVQLFPGVAQLWTELSIAATGDLEFSLANQAAERATELAANDLALLISLGRHYRRLRRPELAGACFERAVLADPSSVEAHACLAEWYEQDRRVDKALDCVQSCLSRHPSNGHLLHVKAHLLHRKGQNSEAETNLRELLSRPSLNPNVAASANHLLGVVLDALGQYDEAWRLIEISKAHKRQTSNAAALERNFDQSIRARKELLAALTPAMIQAWRKEAEAASSPPAPALLGGFPRSGTTLLEQVLGAHPGILVFDEPEAFAEEVAIRLSPPPPAKNLSIKALNSLSAGDCARFRDRYFKSLSRETHEPPGAELFLDKNPSITAILPSWLRVFPRSKLVIALRDPRDVVVSCFFQNLPLTAANVNFLSLERTAGFYADAMDVWLRLRELGECDWIETKYEDLVGNLESEGSRVTNFLGLPWHPAQASFYETAKKKFVYAPTYAEVTKPVYRHSIGRWEHYAAALAPLQELLVKYCKAFGYSA